MSKDVQHICAKAYTTMYMTHLKNFFPLFSAHRAKYISGFSKQILQ